MQINTEISTNMCIIKLGKCKALRGKPSTLWPFTYILWDLEIVSMINWTGMRDTLWRENSKSNRRATFTIYLQEDSSPRTISLQVQVVPVCSVRTLAGMFRTRNRVGHGLRLLMTKMFFFFFFFYSSQTPVSSWQVGRRVFCLHVWGLLACSRKWSSDWLPFFDRISNPCSTCRHFTGKLNLWSSTYR